MTYHSVQYYVKVGDTWTRKPGFTNDPAVSKDCLQLVAAGNIDMEYAWSVSKDPDYTGSADDLEAFKKKLGDDTKETALGSWSTRGCKSNLSEWGV